MRANQDLTHKQTTSAGIFTVPIIVLVIAASMSLSACTGLTSGAANGLSANPASLSFNNTAVGSSSSLTSTLTNNGKSQIDISEVRVTGAGLTAAGVSAGTILTPGQSVPLTVTFSPASAQTLTGASVQIMSNAANSTLTIKVSGTGKATSHSVQLSWTASATNGVGYNVFRGNASGGYGTTPLNPAPLAGTTYTDTTVASGQTYFYVARAIDSAGSSPDSNEVSVTIP